MAASLAVAAHNDRLAEVPDAGRLLSPRKRSRLARYKLAGSLRLSFSHASAAWRLSGTASLAGARGERASGHAFEGLGVPGPQLGLAQRESLLAHRQCVGLTAERGVNANEVIHRP